MPTNIVLAVTLLTLVPAGLALIFLGRTILSRRKSTEPMEFPVLNPDKYRPMERLLREEDLRFLAAQPGYTAGLGRQFRSERRRVFRGYLRSLRKDFRQMALACQLLLIHSAADRKDLASALLRQRVTFGLAMFAVQGRLLLHTAGVGTVDVSGLVESLQTMQEQIRSMVAIPQTMPQNAGASL